MRTHYLLTVSSAALAVVMLSGCTTNNIALAPDRPDRPWPQQAAYSGSGSPLSQYVLPANPALATLTPRDTIDPDHAYALAELIDIAQSANPNTRIAWNEARNAALAVGVAKSAYLPQLSATAMGSYQSGRDSAPTMLGTASSESTKEGMASVLAMQWLLFDFGERAATVDAAEHASLASNIAFTAAHQQTIYGVTIAYYRYLAARVHTDNSRQGLVNADAVIDAARARFKQGVGTIIEVAHVTQARAQANLVLVSAQGAESEAYLSLLSALGVSPLSKLQVASLPLRPLPPALNASVETIVADAITHRPDLQIAYATAQASHSRIAAAEANFMPKLFMSATTSYLSGSSTITALPAVGQQTPAINLSGRHYGNGIFFGVTMPLFDGGLRSAMLNQARNDAENSTARLERTKDGAIQQIVAAQNAVQNSILSYSAAQEFVAAGQTSYDAALMAYKNGVGSVTDVTLANTQLIVAHNSESDSYYSALSATASLAFATGAIAK